MTAKRKTPARRKTTPAQSTASAAPSSAAPGAETAAALIPVPVQPGFQAQQAQIDAPASLPAPALAKARSIESAPPASVRSATPFASARVTHEDRHRLIAKTAYGYAEKAGFRNNPVEDWLMAEREVEARLQRLAS